MLIALVAILVGIALLVVGANLFVDGAASLARRLGMPPLLIGMVVIGFGTSMPELIVSASAAFHGNAGIALGNVVGSNISNFALNLGICAMVCPILVQQGVLNRELPILLGVSALWVLLVRDGHVSRLDAALMLAAFAVAMFITIRRARADQEEERELEKEVEVELPKGKAPASTGKAILFSAVGLAVMLGSSELLVWGAVKVAEHFGVSELVIGLTIVAVGTSLPDLASSIIAARRGEHELALGNVLGAVSFNLMVVTGAAGLIQPMTAEFDLIHRDIAVMAILAVLVCMFCLDRKPPTRISRGEGAVLVLGYVAYALLLIVGPMLSGHEIEIW